MTHYLPRKGKCFLEIASQLTAQFMPQLLDLLGSKGTGGVLEAGEGYSSIGLHKLTWLLIA